MVDIAKALIYLGVPQNAFSSGKVVVASEDGGETITVWDTNLYGPQPTEKQLQTVQADPAYVAFWDDAAVQDRLLTQQADDYANNPLVKYILEQVKVAVPDYVVPDVTTIKEAVKTDLAAAAVDVNITPTPVVINLPVDK